MPARCESLEGRVLFSAGELDEDFSFDGKDARDFYGDEDVAFAVAVQPDGKIVQVGYAENGSQNDIVMIRYNPDGSRDQQFGVGGPDGNGKVTLSLAGNSLGFAVALQKSGKIVVAGRAVAADNLDVQRFFGVLARFRKNGELDTTFSGDGIKLLGFGGSAQVFIQDIVVQRNDRIVVLAYVDPDASDADIALARLRENGALDDTFINSDGYGLVDISAGGDEAPGGIELQDAKDGSQRIIVSGIDSTLFVARFESDGLLDENFGTDGLTHIQSDNDTNLHTARDVAVFPSGRIAAIGYDDEDSVLAVLSPSGSSIDEISTSEQGLQHLYYDVAITSDNAIAIAGATTDGNFADLLVARFTMTSQLDLDTTFGDAGLAKASFEDYDVASANAIAIQADGNIVAAGSIVPAVNTLGVAEFAIARFQGYGDESGWISGSIFKDKNGDGIRNSNDTPHSFVRVFIDLDEDNKFDAHLEPSALSDVNGNYTIAGLLPGNYRVREVVPAGFDRTAPNSVFHLVTLSPADHEQEIDFGNTREIN